LYIVDLIGYANENAHLALPILYNPNVNGLEDARELPVGVGTLLIGRYRVVAVIGKGSFSRVYQCLDLRTKSMVSIKVLRNDKDCLDAGLGEVKVLAHLARHDPFGEAPLVRLRDYFYYKEHLLIVTELLRDSLFQFYRYVDSCDERGVSAYFTPSTIAAIAVQLLNGLDYVHSLGLVHCDMKPENVCIVSASRRKVKIIDFGSSVCRHDTRNSYVQSRWYRAPEVMLGIEWDAKVDMWSVGCLLAELMLGYPLFHGASVAAVLAAQQAVLGPHPVRLLERAPPETTRMYFAPNGTLYVLDPHGHPPGAYEAVPRSTPLASLLKCHDERLVSFLSSLLTYDAEQRPSAKQALQHPFITAHQARPPPQRDAKPRQAASDGSLRVYASQGASGLNARRPSSGDEGDGPPPSPLDTWACDGALADYDSSFSRTASSAASSVESSPHNSPHASPRTLGGGASHLALPPAAGGHRHKRGAREERARGPGVPEDFRNHMLSRGGNSADRRNHHGARSSSSPTT